MSSDSVVEFKIGEVLREIRRLHLEKDVADEETQLRLHCEIFRKFALIDFLLPSLSAPKVARLTGKLGFEKKAMKAEIVDLKTMEIPRMPKEKVAQKEESFCYFMGLPSEVQKMILGCLTSASDKLNVIQAVPKAVKMMDWKVPDLQLEQVLSVVLKMHKLDFQDILNLSQVSQTIRDFLCRHYSATLKTSFSTEDQEHEAILLEYHFQTEQLPLPCLIPTCVVFDVTFVPKDHSRTLRILDLIGASVWDCKMQYSGREQNLEIFRRISNYLTLMPNLRRLIFRNDGNVWEDSIKDEHLLVHIPLPDLPHLETFQMEGFVHKSMETVLFRKYGPCMTRFKRDVKNRNEIVPTFTKTEARRLSVLHLELPPRFPGKARMSIDLDRFEGSPLRSLSVLGGYTHRQPENFQYLFTTFSEFGRTLEDLQVQLRRHDNEREPPKDLTWLANLHFPKVKTLTIEDIPETWAVLLQFPVLETLTLKNLRGTGDTYFKACGVLELSWNVEEMYTSNIWKLLPFLKRVKFVRGEGKGEVKKYEVSRYESGIFQKRFA